MHTSRKSRMRLGTLPSIHTCSVAIPQCEAISQISRLELGILIEASFPLIISMWDFDVIIYVSLVCEQGTDSYGGPRFWRASLWCLITVASGWALLTRTCDPRWCGGSRKSGCFGYLLSEFQGLQRFPRHVVGCGHARADSSSHGNDCGEPLQRSHTKHIGLK